MQNILALLYLIAAVFFILALKGLASPKSAKRGNALGIVGMVIAIVATLMQIENKQIVKVMVEIFIGGGIGSIIALKIRMTAMPQLVAAFHSLIGAAAVLVATAALLSPQAFHIGTVGNIHTTSLIEMSIGLIIGAITFSGSIIAFAKLQGLMRSAPIVFRGQHYVNLALGAVIVALAIVFCRHGSHQVFALITAFSLLIGLLLIFPIGGADMPVVVSMLNSYSGWAASGIGFTLSNNLLIITGALVGASGAILSYIMCKGMNRSIINVILGGFGGEEANPLAVSGISEQDLSAVKKGSAEDAAYLLHNAKEVIIVPGYGMAVAGAQHAIKEMTDLLQRNHVNVRFAIHPVAGRMPGHMNVLLAESNVPYTMVHEMKEINRAFSETDVVFVIGANDITNPAAKHDTASPIYGMPVLDVEKAKRVLFVKRSLSPGYAGVHNELFFRNNTMMLFGDAKEMTEDIIKAMA